MQKNEIFERIWLRMMVMPMDVYVARQPILDRKGEAAAFELLYRSSSSANWATPLDNPDDATVDVLVNALLHVGLERISDGKPCFVNFTQSLLLRRLPHQLPPDNIVVELLEDIEPDPPVIDACFELKRNGYKIALDDVTFQNIDHPLLELADYVKIDFRQTTPAERKVMVEKTKTFKRAKLVAEKVETWSEFEEAKELCFEYFQGYFFCKPVIFKSRDIPHNPLTSLADLYMELHRDEPDLDKLTRSIENDVSLSYKILKMTRTPPFMTRHKVRTIKQALMLLGIEEVKKIVFLLSLKQHANHPSPEPLRISLIRAKICEQLARLKPEVYRPAECFLIGLLSLTDVLLGMTMEEVLRDLPLADFIVDTLLGKSNWPEYELYQCALALESGDWAAAYERGAVFEASQDVLYRIYTDAVAWGDRVFPYVTC
nr:hypothetical protein [Bacillota bacterium]